MADACIGKEARSRGQPKRASPYLDWWLGMGHAAKLARGRAGKRVRGLGGGVH
jgi:hypothetical protein